ncbi:ArnT family glycosyltransferase [Roseicella aerolata]|uniref:Glycosyltransferase RgtA/B/C/D-like domain-containing protein n=1 Tax=Roseicella aerolata TaxID=2883479 RepID=A0A9X1IK25_9PROT|nr:hypothetical protein [Roseicella aerolata]MCB4824495.1 hypothetical protein [Roseicella aerolata]
MLKPLVSDLRSARAWRWPLLALVGVFFLLDVKPGQPWDGDGELFILNALNVIHGQSYSSTGYVVNPTNAIHPATYPPGLPLLLAPVIDLFGVDYVAMKTIIAACYVITLVVVAGFAASRLNEVWALALVAVLGLNPFVWQFKNVLFSEFAFMMFAYVGLFAFDHLDSGADSEPARRPASWLWAVASGLALGAAYEVRAIGVVLLAAVAAICVLRFSRLRHYGLVVLLLAAAEIGLVSWMFPADLGTYVSYFGGPSGDTVATIVRRLIESSRAYAGGVAELLRGGRGRWDPIQFAAVGAVLASSAFGLVQALRRWLTVFEAFLLLYVGALLLYPVSLEPARYALPVLPLIMFYSLLGVQEWNRPRLGLAFKAAAVAVTVALLYMPQFPERSLEYAASVDDPEAMELFREIRNRVPPDALVLGSKPTVIVLYGHRRATNPPTGPTEDEFWHFVRQSRASWIVEAKAPIYDEDLAEILPRLRDQLERVFENRLFALYRIQDGVQGQGGTMSP